MYRRMRVVVPVVVLALALMVPDHGTASSPRDDCSTALVDLAPGMHSIGGPLALPAPALPSLALPSAAARLSVAPPIPTGAAWARAGRELETASIALDAEDGWEALASTTAHLRIPAGGRYVVRFDHVRRQFFETRPTDTLTDNSRLAIERAPDWIADALADNLARLPADRQDALAALIVGSSDPIVDEVAFQVARLGQGPLTDPRFDPELLVENAQLIYVHDPLLQYVDVIDHGSAAAGGDYYSTTRYRVSTPDDPTASTWVEVPREIYYWYVVHPKLSDETVKRSAEADARQATYGHFWREFLFSNPDPARDYSRNADGEVVYPVLGDVLRQPTVLWDGVAVDLPGKRPFADGDVALDVIGNWVSTVMPEAAKDNRPVQPNQIAFEHDGNCGEIQDLLGAAARTALVPVVLTSNHCEDHVWNEFFGGAPTPGWHPYQVDLGGGATRIDRDNVAYDKERGGSKDVSGIWAWRSDGYAHDIVDRYSKSAQIEIRVRDAGDRPVDGARVMIYSEAWGSDSSFSPATFAHTDAGGTCTLRVGDLQNYYVRVTSPLGNFPPENNRITRIVESSVADATYVYTATLAGSLRSRSYTLTTPPDDGAYRIGIRYRAASEIVYGVSPFGQSLDFTEWLAAGRIDLLAMDVANYRLYDRAAAFGAAAAAEASAGGDVAVPVGDGSADAYVVLSNETRAVNAQVVDAEITLYRRTGPAHAIFLPVARRGVVPGGA